MLFQAKKHEDRNRLSRFEQNYGTSDCPNVENVHCSARLTVSIAALVECTEYKIKLLLVFEMLTYWGFLEFYLFFRVQQQFFNKINKWKTFLIGLYSWILKCLSFF